MATLLDERPTGAPAPPEVTVRVVGDGGYRRPPRRLSLAGMLVAGAIVVVGLLIMGAVTGLLDIGNPFATTTVDRSPPALLKRLENLSEYRAASGNFLQRVIIEKHTGFLPDFIGGEKVIFDARGSVPASVDFRDLGPSAVQVRGDGSVQITLPHAKLGDAVIDPDRSRVVDRDRGLLPRLGSPFSDNPTSERDLYRRAARKIERAARHTTLLVRAERNTEKMLDGLVHSLGFDRVDVVFAGPAEPVAGTRARAPSSGR